MIHTPNAVFAQYEVVLQKREIPPAQYADYMKWVRYYLDFCAKYLTTDDKSERKQLFLKKLEEKPSLSRVM